MRRSSHTLGAITGAILLLAVVPVAPVAAQATGSIVGTITHSGSEQPLPYITVSVAGTTRGAQTNPQGRFRIVGVPAGNVLLNIRGLGFRSATQAVTVAAGDSARVNLALTPTALQLDQVVITGVGATTEKRKLGNTVATIDARALENAPVKSVSEVLQGREPGVVALPSGGLVGEGAKIRVRGGSSLSQSNEPIVYVDGVRVDNGGGFGPGVGQNGGSPSRLDDINPEAIESIEILKGAAAATLYGTEAANGVIQIFTKRGSAGPPKYDLHVERAMSRYPNVYEPHAGFARRQTQADSLSAYWGMPIQPYQPFAIDLVPQIFETGRFTSSSLSVGGGAPQVNYYLAGRYETEDGPFGGRQWAPVQDPSKGVAQDVAQRKQANGSLTIFPVDKLLVRVNSMYTEMHDETPDNNNNIYGTISILLNSKPELASNVNPTGAPAFTTIREAMQRRTGGDTRRFGGSVNGNYRILPSVGLDATVGIDVINQLAVRQLPFGWNVDNYAKADVKGARTSSTRDTRVLSLEAKSTWDKQFRPDLTSVFTVGGQTFSSQVNSNYGTGNEFPAPGIEVAGAGAIQTTFEEYLAQVNAGAFAQEQIGIKNFAFLSVGGRYDKHSAFGQSAGGAFYPKASVSFVLSDMPGWHSDFVSTLRLRTAIGRSGLQPGAFDKYTTFASRGSQDGAGLEPRNLGNPNLRPEVSTEWEGGFEVGLWRDRAAIDLTYWNRTVRDALVPRQFPPSGGFVATQLDNIGMTKAHGIEGSVRGTILTTPMFGLSTFVNAAYVRNIVADMGGAPPIKVSGNYARYVNWIKEGYAPGAFFAPKTMNVAYPISVGPGCTPSTNAQLLQYFSTPRNPDDINVLIDRCGESDINSYIGKPAPDWSGSFGGELTLRRNVRISTMWEFRAGNYWVHDLTGAFRRSHSGIGRNNMRAVQIEAVLTSPASTAAERLEAGRIWATELKALTPFDGLNEIHQADFIRWRELSITYDVAQEYAARFGARALSVTLAGRNLGLITRYPGADPEMNAFGRNASTNNLVNNFQEGINAWGLPIPRRFSISLRAGF
jgi:TonB-linked SusC/RagA family outer membrane protein